MLLAPWMILIGCVVGQTGTDDATGAAEVTRLRQQATAQLAAGATADALGLATRLLELGDQPADRLLLARISLAEAERQNQAGQPRNQVATLLADADLSAGRAAADPQLRDEALTFQAFARYRRDDVEGAMHVLDDVLAVHPDQLDALALRGFLRSIGSDPDAARVDLDRAIALAPKRADLRVHRARALASRSPEQAAAGLVAILDLGLLDHATPADTYEILSARPALAIDVLEQMAVALGDSEPVGWFWLGRACSAAVRPAAAVRAFDRALAAAPGDATTLAYRAEARGKVDDLAGMVADLIAVARNEECAERGWAIDRLGSTAAWLAGQRRWAEVVPLCSALLEVDPADIATHGNLGIALNRIGRAADAEQVYRDALLRFGDDARLHNDLGLVLEGLGRDAEAESHYLVAAGAGSIDGLENLALLRLTTGDVAGAQGPLMAALAAQPERLRSIAALDRLWASQRRGSR